METDMIVQFVSFETTITIDEFRTKWDESNKLLTGRPSATLQQEMEGKKLFRYLSQHRFVEDDTRFTFKKDRRFAADPGIEIRVKEVGGYSILQLECDQETTVDGCKVFVFLNKDQELNIYKELLSYRYLNIYEAYYESSMYTYILEFFVYNKELAPFIEQLKINTRISEIGVYKECKQAKKTRSPISKKAMS